MLSGAHMTLAPLVVTKLRERGVDIPVIVGGIVPDHDVDELREAGVAKVLTPGATADEVVAAVRAMPSMAMADRVERLTNLLALAPRDERAAQPRRDRAELAGQYPDQDGARRQAFERDKAALRELGIPIDTEILTGGPYAGQTRYRIDRRKYELADLSLEPEEMHALQVAVAAVRTGSASGQSAIWKLGGALAEEHPPVSALLPDRPELPVLRAAVAARCSITFGYRGDTRRLDPWGLLLRGGFWYVVGHDHDRDEQRTFRVDRFDGGVDGIERRSWRLVRAAADVRPTCGVPGRPEADRPTTDDAQDATVLIDAVRAPAAVA